MTAKTGAAPQQERPHDVDATKRLSRRHVTALSTVGGEAIERLAAELERRRKAARRLPPLVDGRRDPVLERGR